MFLDANKFNIAAKGIQDGGFSYQNPKWPPNVCPNRPQGALSRGFKCSISMIEIIRMSNYSFFCAK